MIGWVAATGEIGLEPLILFLIIFLWTPPHFWALSLNRTRRICPRGRAHAAGRRRKSRDDAADSDLQRSSGAGFVAALGAGICRHNLRRDRPRLRRDLHCARFAAGRSGEADRRPAHRLFVFSISYLFLLFAALLISSSGDRWSSTFSARGARAADGPVQAETLPRPVPTASRFTMAKTDEG